MSWSFRALVLSVIVSWGLAPQLACFMPEETLTTSEMDCCKEMIGDCSMPNMSHACCRTTVRTDIGIAAKAVRQIMLRFDAAERTIDVPAALPQNRSRELAAGNSHAPPPESAVSSLVLRI